MDKEPTTTKAIVILGPTSSGKSALAVEMAKRFDGEIISADSRQVYKDMDLGTGKVEGSWKNDVFIFENIPHYVIDFCDPREEYNVSDFKKEAFKKIEEIAIKGKLPIICGGTGFWISAVVDDLDFPKVEPNLALRKELKEKATEELFEKLKKLDPQRAETIDAKNKIRLIRAIEICEKLGKVPIMKSKVNPPAGGQNSKFKILQIGLDWPKEVLEEKIEKRLGDRWQAGMIEEVEKLKEKYQLSWEKIQRFGLGYFWIPLFIQGKIDEKELRHRVFLAERNYAKRQRTWFKRDKRIFWGNDRKKIEGKIKIFLLQN